MISVDYNFINFVGGGYIAIVPPRSIEVLCRMSQDV